MVLRIKWDSHVSYFSYALASQSVVQTPVALAPLGAGRKCRLSASPGTCTEGNSSACWQLNLAAFILSSSFHVAPITFFWGRWVSCGPCPPFSKSFLSTHMQQYSEHGAFGDRSFLLLVSIKEEFFSSFRSRPHLPQNNKSPSLCTSINICDYIAFWQLSSHF